MSDPLALAASDTQSGPLNVQGKKSLTGGTGMTANSRDPLRNSLGASNGVVLSVGATDGSEFLNIVAKPSLHMKPSLLGISSTKASPSSASGYPWRDLYNGGSSSTSQRSGLALTDRVAGTTFDFAHIGPTKSPRALSPHFAGNGSATKFALSASAANDEYLRINQAYLDAVRQQQPRSQSAVKVNEAREGTVTQELLSIGSPLSPRAQSATYKRPVPSPRLSATGSSPHATNYAQLELSGARVSSGVPANSQRSDASSSNASVIGSITGGSSNHFYDSLGTSPLQHQQLSPRVNRIHTPQQQQQALAGSKSQSPQHLNGLLGLTITPTQAPGSTSASPPKSPRRSVETPMTASHTATGTLKRVRSGAAGAGANAAPLDLNVSSSGALTAPSRQSSSGVPMSPRKSTPTNQQQQQQVQVIPSKSNQDTRFTQQQQQQYRKPLPARRSMLADSSKQIHQQQQQTTNMGDLGPLAVQSVPISPRK